MPVCSATDSAVSDTVTPAVSSSVNINSADVTVAEGGPDDVPLMVMVSSSSSTLLAVGTSSKVTEPDVASASIVTSKSSTAAKPTTPVSSESATATVTIRSASKRTVPLIVAVTLTWISPSLLPSPSPTDFGATLNAIDGTVSSSVISMLVFVNTTLPSVPVIDSDCVGSDSVSLIGVNTKVVDADAAPAGIVIV